MTSAEAMAVWGLGGAAILKLPDLPLQTTQDNVRMFRNLHYYDRVNPRPRIRPAGLTLVEVLIVIVIIAVLAAISFPLAKGMRERARSAQCLQNLRQIGIGLHAYISENNGRFPDGSADVSWAPGITTTRCWYDAAAENMGRTYVPFHKGDPLPEAFGCPSGHGKAYEPAWPYTGDYAANLYLGHPNHGVTILSAVKNPSSTPYVQDTVKQNNFGASIFSSGFSKTAPTAFAPRHGDKGNILWVDGHVSSLTHAEYIKFANDPKHGGTYNFVRGNW
jgi:prepilin-type processing-associated H-X9-DG protein/prepilin-type N-terminal cleavage/methylation domain-containing protein